MTVEEAAAALLAARLAYTAATKRAEQAVANRVRAKFGRATACLAAVEAAEQALTDRERAEDDYIIAVEQLRAVLAVRRKFREGERWNLAQRVC